MPDGARQSAAPEIGINLKGNMKQNKKIAITIFLISIMQMSAMAMSSALSAISATFQNAGDTMVQMVMTLPALFMCISSIISGKLSEYIPKKWLITCSAILIMASGTGGLLLHGNIIILLVWAAVLGTGVGLYMPINSGLMAIYFTGHDREVISGQQVTSATIGGVCLSMIAGFLCETGWPHAYIIYYAIIPGFICAMLSLPKESIQMIRAENHTSEKKHHDSIKWGSWVYIIVMFLFISMYNIIPSNLSMYITEKNLGDSSAAGIATALFLLGGAVAGILYGYIGRYLKDMIITLSFALIVACGGILYFTGNLLILYVTVAFAGTSVGFVMAQCTVRIAEIESKVSVTLALSVMLASNSLAQCIAPAFTKISAAMFHSQLCTYRFLVVLIFGTVLMAVSVILMKTVHISSPNKQKDFDK